jgi:hypothetical protein
VGRRLPSLHTFDRRDGIHRRSVVKRASVRTLALVCLCATIIAPPSTRVRAEAVAQIAADVQKLDAMDVQTLDAATAFVRKRNARDYAIATPDAVDEGRYVVIGGIEQWITIRGENRDNPVLLFLHGGPGDAEDFTTPTSLARTFVHSIRAPRKAFVTIPEGGHFAVFMKRDAFLHELVARMLPVITRA